MSFILDALKKSDAERQQKSTPGFADIPAAREPSRTPRWLWAVGALLAVNLVVLVAILARPEAAPGNTESIAQSVVTPDNEPAPVFADVVAEAKENRRNVEPVTEVEPSQAPEPRPEPAEQNSNSAAPIARQPARGTITDAVPTLNELRADGTLQLPDLHLDLHVYGDTPADRFVMIDMSKYTEGETLPNGPRVKEITPQGVILEHQGTEFLLPSR